MDNSPLFPQEPASSRPCERVTADGVELVPGDRVRLRPLGRADVMDIALDGKTATIVAIEQDFEDRIHLAVTVDDDPGRDLGRDGQIGHRFFFGVDEVEPIVAPRRILIAGIGNIFFGDDAFGIEVVQRLARQTLPEGVRAVDFGIRGLDLTYTLLDGWDAAILVDAARRGEAPGTLYVIEPEVVSPEASADGGLTPDDLLIETHGMDPVKVLRLVAALGGHVQQLLLVGCEPSPGDPEDDMQMSMSPAVQEAVPRAVTLVESLVAKVRGGGAPFAALKEGSLNTKGVGDHDDIDQTF